MIVDLDRQDLEALVKGSCPCFSKFNHPLLKKAGHSYSDQYGRTSWGTLYNLSEEELYQLYKICKNN